MTEIATTSSLIAFGLILVGCFVAVVRDMLRTRRERQANQKPWILPLLK